MVEEVWRYKASDGGGDGGQPGESPGGVHSTRTQLHSGGTKVCAGRKEVGSAG